MKRPTLNAERPMKKVITCALRTLRRSPIRRFPKWGSQSHCRGVGRDRGVGRGLGVALGVGVGLTLRVGVAVGVGDGVALGVGIGVGTPPGVTKA